MNRLQSTWSSWREYLAPVTGLSTFSETGQITPEEFVRAGDYLVYRFPTWAWRRSGGDGSRLRDFLPADKQFLVTRRVPSHKRTQALHEQAAGSEGRDVVGEDGWFMTHDWMPTGRSREHAGVIPDLESVGTLPPEAELAKAKFENLSVDCEVLNMDDMVLPDDDDDDVIPHNAHILSTRTYDLFITYDKYYRTPRLWLSGYTESGTPLGPNEIMQDVSSDYADKTVTWERFPHNDLFLATVHPCRHASVMKLFIDRLNYSNQRDNSERMRVDQYMVVFLKFMGSVLPTIEHDNTMGV